MPIVFLIPPLIKRVRKRMAKKKGKEYVPLFPKTTERVEKIKTKYKLKTKKNGKTI